jgi:hypothetical protein
MYKVIIYVLLCAIAAYADNDQIASYGNDNRYDSGYESYKPMPYSFGYQSRDKYGTELGRQESGDEYGAVKGSYSYLNEKGLSRKVEYIADKDGFRAVIKTNEPGVEKSRPADVVLDGPDVAWAEDNYKRNDDYKKNYEDNYKRNDDDYKKNY